MDPKVPEPVTHAGGVVLRSRGGAREVLVVTSKDGSAWVLPKGHVEQGETVEAAAVREIAEEAGIVARIVRPLSVGRVPALRAVIAWFLCVAEGEVARVESREVRWLEPDAARELLTFAETRAVLDEGLKDPDGSGV